MAASMSPSVGSTLADPAVADATPPQSAMPTITAVSSTYRLAGMMNSMVRRALATSLLWSTACSA